MSDKLLADGTNLATENYLNLATSTIIAQVDANETLINNLNDISAADVWAHSTKDVTLSNPKQVWDVASSTLTTAGSIGKQVAENLDMAVSAGGSLTAADVWSHATRTLTETATSSIALAVWSEATRTLTDYGNDITAEDVWNVLSSTLTAENTIGKQLATNVVASTTIATAVWTSPARSLTTFGTLASDVATAVWANGTRSLTTFGTLVSDIWSNPTRRLSDKILTSGGNLTTEAYMDTATSTIITRINALNDIAPEDVWNYIGQAVHGGQIGDWTVTMTDTQQILAGNEYRVKIYTKNAGLAEDGFTAPLITIYDVNRNVVVSSVPMTDIGVGQYEYVYSVADGAAQGVWETIVNTEVIEDSVVVISDYWEVRGAPAQVIVNSMSDTTVPVVSAYTTITNEGSGGYEYLYEWCVVSQANNPCGGGDDVFYASAAKYIQASEDWNTNLTADVPNPGNYYFKVVVYFGSESSGASRSFTAVAENVGPSCGDNSCNNGETCSSCSADCGQCNNNGGGGGGGGGGVPPPVNPPPGEACDNIHNNPGDMNVDSHVNSVDFSILLYFWRTLAPFSNSHVDINCDTKVDSVDFSILLYHWGQTW